MSKKEQIALRLPPSALAMIDELVGSIYGTSRADVARNLVLDQLKQLAEKSRVTWHVIREDNDGS